MPRRAHRKSRNGCLECKRRHVKCDEKRPVCSNCISAERDCGYGTRTLNSNATAVPPLTVSPTPETPLSSASAGSASFSDQPVNMLHVELFHNFCTKIHDTFDPTGSVPWLAELLSQSITTPYLVNELLAFSSLHLSTQRPARREFYHFHAAQLQTHALAIFNEKNPEVTEENCLPLFLFSCLRLHHGSHTIIGQAWQLLNDSTLKPAFDIGGSLYKRGGPLGAGYEKLLDLVVAANLGNELTVIYRQAIETLQTCTNVADIPDSEAQKHLGAINGVITWPMLVKLEFSDLLGQGRPEALVILAHYAVLVHRFRESWLFADSGKFLIQEIGRCLGEEWEEWMAWPNDALCQDT
ncbi:hypothetical protein ASPVEDRAFT_877960 [Aspergillus versicolor CBS 583.65]|uniref:Zn(2)-C6 fungal-type domain-containing protein n=1 Tax=Aspergillus versicolor CBS 583.65 TaxID=1036611 RepID=A0A1L9Q204_ASPVE|nr:uncharacterized protein ASPVEDRAFT_877960 [Aspergillus versicolor CBS 583.65]OJJ07768.1 hypothetical protein ASPVEDRAFT_877960 [Aspergillus versicolor CBS 583.65]